MGHLLENKFLAEGSSMNRPPAFSGEDYPYWKDRMEMFIKSTQYRLWHIITYGDTPTIRDEPDWNQDDFIIMQNNTKARYTLICALSKQEYNKVCLLKTAKEIWDSLALNYEGTEDVRLRKAATLTRQYELFTMKDGESVDDMFGRLQVLLNNLEALGQHFSKAQVNLKILDAFPKEWEAKTTAVQECKDMKSLAWDELLGILRCHEVVMESRKPSAQKYSAAFTSGETSFRREEKRPLKAMKVQTELSENSGSGSEGSTDDEMALMSRKFKQMLKKRGKFKHSSRRKDNRWKKKKKSLMATWEDSTSSDESCSDEEHANMCLMADPEEFQVETLSESYSTSSCSSSDNEEEISYDILLSNCHMLTLKCKKYKDDFKSALADCIDLRKSNESLTRKVMMYQNNEFQTTLYKSSDDASEVIRLKKELSCLTKDLGKFSESSKALNMLLNSHQDPRDKSGIGYIEENPSSSFINRPAKHKCDYCGKHGHSKFRCFLKKKHMAKKAKKTNAPGPKKLWVPKSMIIPVADLLGRKRPGFKLVPGQWLLATYDGKKVYVPRPQTT